MTYLMTPKEAEAAREQVIQLLAKLMARRWLKSKGISTATALEQTAHDVRLGTATRAVLWASPRVFRRLEVYAGKDRILLVHEPAEGRETVKKLKALGVPITDGRTKDKR